MKQIIKISICTFLGILLFLPSFCSIHHKIDHYWIEQHKEKGHQEGLKK